MWKTVSVLIFRLISTRVRTSTKIQQLTWSAALVRHCTTARRCSLSPWTGSLDRGLALERRPPPPPFLPALVTSSGGVRAESGRRRRLSTKREYATGSMPNASKRCSSHWRNSSSALVPNTPPPPGDAAIPTRCNAGFLIPPNWRISSWAHLFSRVHTPPGWSSSLSFIPVSLCLLANEQDQNFCLSHSTMRCFFHRSL